MACTFPEVEARGVVGFGAFTPLAGVRGPEKVWILDFVEDIFRKAFLILPSWLGGGPVGLLDGNNVFLKLGFVFACAWSVLAAIAAEAL